jgi:hypothetical protein
MAVPKSLRDTSSLCSSTHVLGNSRPRGLRAMTVSRTTSLVAAACFTLGCGGTRHNARTPISANAAPIAPVADAVPQTDVVTKATLTRFVQSTGAILDTILAAGGNYIVAATKRDEHANVVTLRYDSTGIHKIGPDIAFDHLPYPTVRLVHVGQRTTLRVITFDALAEDIVGTAVDRVDTDNVQRDFADPTEGCKAADFVDSSGTYTLRTYVDSPFASDCLNPCAEDLRKVTGTEPAEIVVLRRSKDGVWRRAAADTDSTVARGYLSAAAALHNGSVPSCAVDSTRILQSIARWQRAR